MKNRVAIYGGLGNQMFQYAFFMSLNEYGKKARISFISYFYFKHHRDFDLRNAFDIPLSPWQKFMCFFIEYCGFIHNNKIFKRLSKKMVTWEEAKQSIYREKAEFVTDQEVYKQMNTLFYGTWQSEAYFKAMAHQVKSQFTFRTPDDKINRDTIQKIKGCNAVSLHIRRGDYLSAQWQNSLHVIKDLTYYKKAVEYIDTNVESPVFFIFSDDIQWVKQNLPLKNAHYIDNNKAGKSYVDMYLMSICKHNIIANSTFSWWGAWLNNNDGKIVIMPGKWMNDNSCTGIFPEGWVKLPV